MGGDSGSEGHGFESQHHMDIFTYICCKKFNVWLKLNCEVFYKIWIEFFNGPFPASCFFISYFSIQLTANMLIIKFCQWLDSNWGPLVLVVAALQTEPQPLPIQYLSQWLWLSWQSGRFRYQRSEVRIQIPANFYRTFIYCELYCIEKTKIKEKEAGNGPFF